MAQRRGESVAMIGLASRGRGPSVQASSAPRARPGLGWRPHTSLAALTLTAAYVTQAALGAQPAPLLEAQGRDLWRQVTGGMLLVFLATQWVMPWLRLSGELGRAARFLPGHRLLGAAGPLLLYLHSAKLGYGHLSILGITFLSNVLVAALDPVALAKRRPVARGAWVVAHVTLSTALIALACHHVVIGVYYE